MPTQALGWGTRTPSQTLEPIRFERRDLRADDVAIRITYAGICHSDLHHCRGDWGDIRLPAIPGHEIVGEVTAVGPEVSRIKVGDTVAVGTIVDSCLQCRECKDGWEQFCLEGATYTYGHPDRQDGSVTCGGYSDHIVTREHFVFAVPEGLDPARAAPLLCAGITSWSPLRQYKEHVAPGKQVAVAGIGGLGHLGVKFAAALGAEVTAITTSESKAAEAQRLGAHHVLVSSDRDAMKAARSRFDFILDTIPVAHDVQPYLGLLRRAGRMVIVGAIAPLPPIHGGMLISNNRAIGGSGVGGVPETVEMLEFCAKHQLYPEVEMIRMGEVNNAWERMEKGDVRYRFVIDMSTLEQTAE
jgi:uncharacterized zinc-type alcohol dehydrogenase-like protein